MHCTFLKQGADWGVMKNVCIVGGLLFSGYALACDCVGKSVADLYTDADAILLGEVISTADLCKLDKSHAENSLCVGPGVWVIKPYEVFKQRWDRLGNAKGGFKNIYVVQDGSNCDSPLKVGGKYLLFAKAATWSVFSTNQCAGTMEAAGATSTLQKLQKLRTAFSEVEKP
jgi:hypothetical protein